MRFIIKTSCNEEQTVPFNYHLQLNNSIRYALVIGIENLEKSDSIPPQHLENLKTIIIEEKNYTYSKFNFFPRNINSLGFYNVQRAELYFSAPFPDHYFIYFVEIFKNYHFVFRFENEEKKFTVNFLEKLAIPEFKNRMHFITKSPIAVCTNWKTQFNTVKKHFYNYMKYKERKKFINKLKQSLIDKYEMLNGNLYSGNSHIFFKFDNKYINENKGKISKLIHFENDEKVKAFEAPFVIEADPELIRIGYECGFGEEGDRGFGCVEINEEK
ncbi:MAG: CRISPR-associated endoribonuclease Cas6 [Candidatus Marinimicrobia bacterium]|nr:CRISPR-associated endoribonuclease Cas6 [Candidatus Neomarinimicrobiota bacterium]